LCPSASAPTSRIFWAEYVTTSLRTPGTPATASSMAARVLS
jgi:hypothetical protein